MVRAQQRVVWAEFDATEFVIGYETHDRQRGRISLETVFKRCQSVSDQEARRLLFEFVDLPSPEERGQGQGWAAVADRLRPLIRQAGNLDMRMEGARLADHTLWRPILPCLMETAVIDGQTKMHNTNPAQLQEWGVDSDTVFDTARANMAELGLDTIGRYDPRDRGGMLYIPDTSGDDYAGSLPLVDGWLAGIGTKAGARPIVFVAQNAGVLVGAEFSEEHVLHLVRTARELFDDALREVSPVPYTLDDHGRLVPYRVPRTHAAWREIRSAETVLAAHVYEQQYEHLRADLDAELTDDRAAKLGAVRKKDGVETTWTPWTDTVPTLLPRANNVSLTNPDTGATFFVPWQTLSTAIDLRPVEGFYPPRYRVEFHPDADTMAHLRAAEKID
ncbi:Uncharacterised protein [Nocardia africana]|uniref:Uncharacterized protein n=2 Tax=Nocardia africana TaxID=134964 RepID=A0A378WWR8_9NOCA|nr:Uncharacterised protein [Nocardia africana]